jgi:hypothetical protein
VAAIGATGEALTIVYLLKGHYRIGGEARLLFLIQEKGFRRNSMIALNVRAGHWRVLVRKHDGDRSAERGVAGCYCPSSRSAEVRQAVCDVKTLVPAEV